MKSKILYLLLNIIIAVVVSSFIFDLKYQDTRIVKAENFFGKPEAVRQEEINGLFPPGSPIGLFKAIMTQSGFSFVSTDEKSVTSGNNKIDFFIKKLKCRPNKIIDYQCAVRIYAKYDQNGKIISVMQAFSAP